MDLVNLKDDMPVVDKYVQTWLDRVERILDRAEGVLTRLRDETEAEITVRLRKKGTP